MNIISPICLGIFCTIWDVKPTKTCHKILLSAFRVSLLVTGILFIRG